MLASLVEFHCVKRKTKCAYAVFVSGVCTEEAPRGRVPPEDGGALRMCPLHGKLSQGSLTHSNTAMSTAMTLYRLR